MINPDSTRSSFARLADRATDHVTFDADSIISTVKARHRQRVVRRRRLLLGLPAAAIVTAAALAIPSFLAPGSIPAAQAYEFGAVDEPVLARLAGDLTVSYLPQEFAGELTLEPAYSYPAQADGADFVVFETSCYAGTDELTLMICVATAPDLTVDTYLEHNWFNGEETEVGGAPALINAVTTDGAGGILFSPERGTVVEIHVRSDLSGDLRSIVAGMALSEP